MVTTRNLERQQQSLKEIEFELKKRVNSYPYTPWGTTQNNPADSKTNFIYHTFYFEDLLKKTTGLSSQLKNYSINRWFNFWHAQAIERVFCEMPGVVPSKNGYDQLVDFSIQGIPFDHKTTVYPKDFRLSFPVASQSKSSLIWHLYLHQSQARRFHRGNRLFIVLFDSAGSHWKLRAEISVIAAAVRRYVKNFDQDKLTKIPFSDNHVALSDVIWIKS